MLSLGFKQAEGQIILTPIGQIIAPRGISFAWPIWWEHNFPFTDPEFAPLPPPTLEEILFLQDVTFGPPVRPWASDMDSGPQTTDQYTSLENIFEEVTPLPARTRQLTKASEIVSWEDNEVYVPACIILALCVWCPGLDLIQLTLGESELVYSIGL